MSEKYCGRCPDCKGRMFVKSVLVCENCGSCTCICGRDPIALEAELKRLRHSVELDKRSLDAQTAILEEYSMRIPKLKAELAAKDARIAELEAEIVEALGEDRASAVRKDYIETVKILAKHGYHSDPSLWQRVTHVLNRIAALEAENKRLRDALKKIAQCNPQDRLCEYIVQIARAALPVKSQPLDSCENMQDSPSPGAEPRA